MKNYGNQRGGFAIEATREWIETPLERPSGVCFRSCDGAVVTVSICVPAPSVVSDPAGRTERIYQELKREAPNARQNWDAFRPVPEGISTASGQLIGPAGVHGKISILHGGMEYAIRYSIPITSPFSAIQKVNDIVLSFRLSAEPDTELFIDPQKSLKGRRRWWHFWRLLGH
jgi:hypothetical protein